MNVQPLSTPPQTTTDNRETAAVVADIVQRLGEAQMVVTGNDQSRALLAVLPTGKKIEDLTPLVDKYLPAPLRRRGKSTLRDTDSFIALVNRFRSDASIVFADPTPASPSLLAVFDYHPSGSDGGKAAFLEHAASYTPQLSEAWTAWSKFNGILMAQADFAAFIEEHITEIIVPNFDDPQLKTFAGLVQGRFAEPSELLQLSRGLQVNVEATVKQAVTLATGEISLRYEETHRDGEGQPISIANLFQVCIPVFYAGDLYRIAARLRYRLTGGRVSWFYQLVRSDLVFDDAFRGIVSKVKSQADVPVLLGAPEK